MSDIRVNVGPNGLIDINVGTQHLSRITGKEAREIIATMLVFGGKQLREDIHHWLNGGTIQSVADFLSPAEKELEPQ